MGERSVLDNMGLHPIAVGGMAAVAPRAARLPHWSHPGAFSLLVTVTVFFLISLATPPDYIDPDIEELLEL